MKAKLVLPQVNCKYGAPMGRKDNLPTEDHPAAMGTQKVHLQKMKLYDGAYDFGGAYWGYMLNTSMYWAHTEATDEKLGIDIFIRASCRNEVKEKILAKFPNMKFLK